MTVKVGVNGFGRIGRLTLRALWGSDTVQFVQINDPGGNANTLAHLLNYDSVHGKWAHLAESDGEFIVVGSQRIKCTSNRRVEDTDWSACDIVIEASGRFRTKEALNIYLKQGVNRVVVSAPVKEEGILNVVMGVNDDLYNKELHTIITAASCTTNCLAPVVKVIDKGLGIKRGSFTTIHNITNTQTILDAPHKDLRRARACGMSLIPTTTGSATAIIEIFPQLQGKLDGHAIRVPLANASLTDCVFEVGRETSVNEVNDLLKHAADNSLSGILGYEEKPLVSIDYRTDPRSSIVDALSTMVVQGTHVKLYLWYDNEWGYANRLSELVELIAQSEQS
jgi:glyceraldehyde 3-phosphate dehydrogenase